MLQKVDESEGVIFYADKSTPVDNQPDEIVHFIFQNLPLSSLATASQVCKRWHAIARSDDLFWKQAVNEKLGSRAFDYFAPLVKVNKTTWEEVFRIVTPSFLCFLDTVLTDYIPSLINQNFNINNAGQFLAYGAWRFTIVNNSGILIKNQTSNTEYYFQVEEGKFITDLAHNGHFIFALCKNGQVLQIDYRKNKLVNTIETSITTGHEYFKKEENSHLRDHATRNEGSFMRDRYITRNPFYAANGTIFISYFMQLMDVIHYQKTNTEMLSCFEFELIDWGLEILFHENTVYLAGMIDTDEGEVEVHRQFLNNQTNSKPLTLPNKAKNVSALAIQGQLLYIAQREGWLTVCKIDSASPIKVVDVKKLFDNDFLIESIGILEDFLVASVIRSNSYFIVFLNRYNLQEVARIDTVIAKDEVIHPALFEKLFELVRGDLTWDIKAIISTSALTRALVSQNLHFQG